MDRPAVTFVDSFAEWPRTVPGRTVAVGVVAGALGGGVVGALSLLGDEGFTTGGALLLGGAFGALHGAGAGGLTGVVAGVPAGLLTRVGRRPARVALTLVSGICLAVTGRFTWPPQGWAHQAAVALAVGAVAAVLAWALGPWCLAPGRRTREPQDR